MIQRTRKHAAGFTLLELLAAVVIMSIISVTLMPVIGSASESFAVARNVRSSTDRAGFALDRMTRIIRQAPIGDAQSGIGIASATSSSLVFTDGTGFQLTGTTLEMLVVGGLPVPLCFDVSSLQLDFLGDNGITNTLSAPETTHRIAVTIQTENVSMSVLVHPRIWIGQVAP